MNRINRETILSWFLAFVVIWFGVSEISHPTGWVSFVPAFVKVLAPVTELVVIHGFLLLIMGVALIFNFHRRASAIIIMILILEIVINFIQNGTLNPISVRDIGLFGMALALSFRS